MISRADFAKPQAPAGTPNTARAVAQLLRLPKALSTMHLASTTLTHTLIKRHLMSYHVHIYDIRRLPKIAIDCYRIIIDLIATSHHAQRRGISQGSSWASTSPNSEWLRSLAFP